MSRKTIIILLIISVCINVGLLATLFIRPFPFHDMPPDRFPRLNKWIEDELNLTKDQKKMIDEIVKSDEDDMKALGIEIHEKKKELALLLGSPNPNPATIDQMLSEISTLELELQKKIANKVVTINSVLTPEQQKLLNDRMEKRLCPRGGGRMHRGGGWRR